MAKSTVEWLQLIDDLSILLLEVLLLLLLRLLHPLLRLLHRLRYSGDDVLSLFDLLLDGPELLRKPIFLGKELLLANELAVSEGGLGGGSLLLLLLLLFDFPEYLW